MISILKKANKEIEQKAKAGTLTVEDLVKLTEKCSEFCDENQKAEIQKQFNILKENGIEVPEQKKSIPEKISILPKRWEC